MKETSPKSNNGTILDINESFKIEFDPISDALAAIRNGECIIVVDDERRENEGDLICAAQFATPQQINFMATEGRGLICLAMQGEKLDSLDLPLMVDRNTDENQTAFTISIDAGPENNVTTGISLLTTGIIASGGETIESVESVRKFAPRIYASQNRAITANDYEALIPAKIYPETESISVFGGEEMIPPQYGKVFISIKPRTGDFLPNLIKENIKTKLKKYAVAGIVPEILDLKYLYIEVDSKIYYNTNLAPSGEYVSTLVQENAESYANSTELNRYGARFKYSKFLKVIDESDAAITSNITTLQMRRDMRAVLNSFAEYQIGFGNEFYIKSMGGYNIKSTSFRISGISQDIYLSDVPNSNRETGSIFFFTLPSPNSTSPTIVRRNVGTINYKSGIITLNPVNIISGKLKDGQTIIELSACPKSNDVVGLQDLYLQLDTSNSNFEMIVDDIASGMDPAASNYTVTSSYHNGNLVR